MFWKISWVLKRISNKCKCLSWRYLIYSTYESFYQMLKALSAPFLIIQKIQQYSSCTYRRPYEKKTEKKKDEYIYKLMNVGQLHSIQIWPPLVISIILFLMTLLSMIFSFFSRNIKLYHDFAATIKPFHSNSAKYLVWAYYFFYSNRLLPSLYYTCNFATVPRFKIMLSFL